MPDNKENNIAKIPDHFTAVTPWIISPSTEKLIDFLKHSFEAQEIPNSMIKNEDGLVIHAVIKIGDAMIQLFDSRSGWLPTPAFMNLYVEDIDLAYNRAIRHGATSVTDITTLWFGEKVCRVLDPFGNLWWINERIEEVDFTNPEEIQKRATTSEAIEKISYIQQSLDEALKAQKNMLKIRTED